MDKERKIAICFSGAIRNAHLCIPTIQKYIINNLNADVFLHLWSFTKKTNTQYNFKWKNDTCSAEYVINALKPKNYIIDEYTSQWETIIINESKIDINKFDNEKKKNYGFNCCSMYYKIFKCYELVEEYCIQNNIKYDIVIRARIDFIWEENLYFENFMELGNNQNDILYLIRDKYAKCSKKITNDKFFAGSMTVMKKMCNIFNDLHIFQQNNVIIDGQEVNEYNIKQHNFIIKWIGNKNTYYKFHKQISFTSNKIKINIKDNQNNDILKLKYELIYNLLMNNYIVIVNYDIEKTHNYLENFLNFEKDLNLTNYDIDIINCNDELTKFTVNDNTLLLNNYTFTYALNFHTCIINIILCLLRLNIHNKTYMFLTYDQINDIDIDEKIIFKLTNHGYYACKYIKKIDNNKHEILFNNNKHIVKRKYMHIINILKYANNNSMPID
jgi:hypothetical protein